jgi:carboxypeptidase Q
MVSRRLLLIAAVALAGRAQDAPDLNVVHRIKEESFRKGKVVETLSMLTDRYGPRLTASPEYDAAAEWLLTRLREWGLVNPHLEKWGPFGRSWSLRRFNISMTAPQYAPLIGFPLAWSESTKGAVSASPVLIPIRRNDPEKMRLDLDRIRKTEAGKLRGRVVMITALRDVSLQLAAPAARLTDAQLDEQAAAPAPEVRKEFDYSRLVLPEEPAERLAFIRAAPPAFHEALGKKYEELDRELHAWLRKEGAVAILRSDRRGDGGTVFGEHAGWYEAKFPSPLPTIVLTPEHYNRIARLLEKKAPVTLQIDLEAPNLRPRRRTIECSSGDSGWIESGRVDPRRRPSRFVDRRYGRDR